MCPFLILTTSGADIQHFGPIDELFLARMKRTYAVAITLLKLKATNINPSWCLKLVGARDEDRKRRKAKRSGCLVT